MWSKPGSGFEFREEAKTRIQPDPDPWFAVNNEFAVAVKSVFIANMRYVHLHACYTGLNWSIRHWSGGPARFLSNSKVIPYP